ncbi:MAG: T9SS type A sorting domain-containing protein [Taibaiella sp.]|nr:T9SS type A sorting domain-containing protein [Taibaiella sp.]
MWAGISTDGGMTFPGHMAVDTTNWMIMSCPSSGPDGFVIGDSLYTVFMSTSTGTALVHLGRASLSGMAAKHTRITGMFTGLSSQNYPRIANSGSAAITVWKQNTTSGNSIAYSFTNNISSGFSGYSTITGATGSGIMNADVTMAPGAVHVVWEDDNTGNVMYMKGTYVVNTAVPAITSKELIEVYPNPATNEFSVSLRSLNIGKCYLTDNVGRNIELTPNTKSGKVTFSLKGIVKGGYYFVMTDDAGKNYYSKLIVQ